MYRWFVRRQIRAAFASLSRGDGDALTAHLSPTVHHAFPGNGALGGERHDLADVQAWFQRLFRLLPGLQFQIHTVAVDGNPLDTRVGVEWTNTGTLLDGSHYSNDGAHIIRLSRGKITAFHAYLNDPDELAAALARLSDHGLDEAAAPPIGGPDLHAAP